MADQNAPKMSYAELLALYDTQEAEKKALAIRVAELEESKKRNNTLSFKVRVKGEKYKDSTGEERIGKGVGSLYGLGRFPVSLYRTQWLKVREFVTSGKLDAALEENKGKLAEQE